MTNPYKENMRYLKAILFGGLVFLALLNIVLNDLMSFLPKANYMGFERWIALILLISAFVYLALKLWREPEGVKRIRLMSRRACSREQVILIGLFLWYILVCVIYRLLGVEDIFQTNDYCLYMAAMTALTYFSMAEYAGRRRARAVIEGIIHIVVTQHTIYSAWCLWHYLQLDFIVFPSGKKLAMAVNNSLSMGNNRNIAGTAAGVMVTLCVYMILTQKPLIKGLYIIQMLVNMAVLLLSNCRSAFLGIIAVLGSTVFIVGWKKLHRRETRLRLAISLLLALSCIVLVRFSQKMLFRYLNNKMVEVQTVTENTETDDKDAEETAQNGAVADGAAQKTEASTENVIKERNLTSAGLNGRGTIWKHTLQVIFHNPRTFLIGVTRGQLRPYYREVCNITPGPYHAHNLYLQMAASLGVPAMLVFVYFLISLGIRCVRIMRAGDRLLFQGAWYIPLILLYMLIVDMFEPMLFTSQRVNLPFFYMMAGWIVALDKRYFTDSGFRLTPGKE